MKYASLLLVLSLGCGKVSVPALPDTGLEAKADDAVTDGLEVSDQAAGDAGADGTSSDVQGIDPTPMDVPSAAQEVTLDLAYPEVKLEVVMVDPGSEADAGSTPCHSDADCGPDFWCLFETGVCAGPGTCKEVPKVCPSNLQLVCGCDGKTYNNPCLAALARVSIASMGACPSASCKSTLDCVLGKEYCNKPLGECLGKGQCEAIPLLCPAPEKTVCGCDGKTYPDKCHAAQGGTSVKAPGPCL